MFWKKNNAFTLLEVMLAVALTALSALAIYRFVESTLSTVRICRVEEAERGRVASFFRFVQARLMELPEGRDGAVLGEAHRFDGVPCDELSWIARRGNGVLTRYAAGEWVVTLTAREMGKGRCEAGLRRRSVDGLREGEWLPLLDGVRGLEFRFFDPVRKEWMEKWTDVAARPSLVRVKLWRYPSPEAEVFVLTVPPRAKTEAGSGSAAPLKRARVES
jgi:prepilin-type N-terminal cleavage/methylation domain-containing protein